MSDTTREPVAWLVLDGKLEPFSVHRYKTAAVEDANDCNGLIFPLYRDPPPPTLTDAERGAIQEGRDALNRQLGSHDYADLLTGLLARASGQTSGQDSRGQSQSAPENTPACDAQEPAKQTVTLTDEERLAINFAAEQFSIAVLREQSYKRAPMCLSDAILYQNTITALAILRDLLARLDNKQEDT